MLPALLYEMSAFVGDAGAQITFELCKHGIARKALLGERTSFRT